MAKRSFFVVLTVLLAVAVVFSACSPKAAETPAPAEPAAVPAVSDGSEDLTIDCRINLAGTDEDNYFHWKGNVRYMAAEDSYDTVSGASVLGSTHLFMMYLYDVEAKATMGTGLRGLFLFGVNGSAQVEKDNLHAVKNADGSLTVQYVHRGTAYRFITDKDGVLSLPDAKMESRKIGTPQELEAEFTSDGTAMGVDFDKVWSSNVSPHGSSADAMYFWDGDLKVALEGDVLSLKGVLTAVAR